jgi:hypothetical protein
MALVTILLIAAIILFVLAAFGVSSRVSLTDVGLACVAGALLLG